MRTTRKEINFKGQNIYVGIDTHLKNWAITIMTEELLHKTFSQDPNPILLANYLKKNFPGGDYYSAYEASFCGFGIHRELLKLGLKNIVVNPADIPTTDKEKKQKEDKRDSRKIAKTLRAGDLKAIYVPSKESEELRSLVRYRKTLVRDISRGKNRIKSHLYFHGIKIPEEQAQPSKYWSNRFTTWLKGVQLSTSFGTIVLQDLLDNNLSLRKKLLFVTKEIRSASKSDRYLKAYLLLTSVPGIGPITAMTIISELEDIARFKNLDKLCSYIGLVPTTNSTGETDRTGGVTPRANRALRSSIIESAWVAARIDPALSLAYNELCKRMKPTKAIIRIAKKLLNRVRYVLINETEYVHSIIS
ncbi:MAG: IS110 family transposase [Bacteroidales bacterium]|nr:IS110 family transposase [Bacteroidales bacterium]